MNLTISRFQKPSLWRKGMLVEVKDKDSLFNLFKKELNYIVDPIEEYIELPDSAIRLLKTPLTLISDYKGEGSRFRIYHAEVSSLRRSDFRTILEPFYKRYPQVNALFVFTSDDSNSVCFVSSQRLPGTEPGKTNSGFEFWRLTHKMSIEATER